MDWQTNYDIPHNQPLDVRPVKRHRVVWTIMRTTCSGHPPDLTALCAARHRVLPDPLLAAPARIPRRWVKAVLALRRRQVWNPCCKHVSMSSTLAKFLSTLYTSRDLVNISWDTLHHFFGSVDFFFSEQIFPRHCTYSYKDKLYKCPHGTWKFLQLLYTAVHRTGNVNIFVDSTNSFRSIINMFRCHMNISRDPVSTYRDIYKWKVSWHWTQLSKHLAPICTIFGGQFFHSITF
jgi:hypothetical protein